MHHRTRRFGVAALVAAAGLTIVVGAGQTAHADPSPSSIELLQMCDNGADSCVFHPDGGPSLFAGDPHQIGTTLFNCGPGAAAKSVAWTETSAESNSIGISFVNAQEGSIVGALGAFKSEFEITYGHRWGSSDATSRATDVKVAPGDKGWLVRSSPMQRISGTYELRFGTRFYGHYYWYVPFTITAAAPDATDTEVVSQREQPMTAGEKTQCG